MLFPQCALLLFVLLVVLLIEKVCLGDGDIERFQVTQPDLICFNNTSMTVPEGRYIDILKTVGGAARSI